MAELWFIRHFRTPWNAESRFQGQRDIAIDAPLGEADAAQLAQNLRALEGQSFARVLTSPLTRARETAALHGFPEAEPLAALSELNFGLLEGRTRAEFEAAYPSLWENAPQDLPLGEAFETFMARIAEVAGLVREAEGPVLAFGHGAWLGGLRSHLAGGNGSDLAHLGAPNGALLRLRIA